MTNGRGAAAANMASFMTKKKKYKFQVDICLEELMEVPFVSAVLFAKLRLLDGGNFQDHSSRQEVTDHKVQWDANFSFPCKMMANASTGVMEKCIMRISIRKESKGGRSFAKLGFVDLNLAEYAGAGLIHKKALLEGYDARHRQDNSMLKFRIQLNMISGDILFKAPSPSLKHKQITIDDAISDQRSDEFSSGSLAGSIASGSSGFGSLPKKRPPLLSSELVIGQTLPESSSNPTSASSIADQPSDHSTLASSVGERLDAGQGEQQQQPSGETGHSRNSSNTSQLSKASGYSSIHSHSHSRQSSSGDSAGHIRASQHYSLRKPTSKFLRTYTYPKHRVNIPTTIVAESSPGIPDVFLTPQSCPPTPPDFSLANGETFHTPRGEFFTTKGADDELFETPDCFGKHFHAALQKSASAVGMGVDDDDPNPNDGVVRSKSEFVIPRVSPTPPHDHRSSFSSRIFKSNSVFSFLTPRPYRKHAPDQATRARRHTPPSPSSSLPFAPPEARATSLSSLRLGNDGLLLSVQRQALGRNPSAGSLAVSDTGSLDRAKAAYERRKKNPSASEDAGGGVSGRVEITRVNPEDFIEELLKSTNLEQPDDSAETSGLQLYIAKDGTAAVGSHEVKSQMSTGVQGFKQVVMDNR
ncbi:uncharacterized protein LOC132701918 isoform X2 [Cylas formicarius]|uniref:uncharacterized protein LOC132701918 isoform X2 n=1 Tax=Cylas formicarius TaxID=197179 RepID=UPI0029589FAA|nr:uncharacterized protein LOC132701918 isoform X2 [Cylas formicarius]